ncbi:MAG: TIGR03936 family radical SAM-associated protein [Lachnospiraceae bacterium]|nr:TIGR03936 family radical SAM-associated protein [Lachnospiraceae bacterium]
MKVRIRFTKSDALRYVGHLDLLRFFQKAMRRAHVPMAFSEGFHPHQIMSFASPLGVGITSQGEYLDIEITEQMDPSAAMEALNAQMVEGVTIQSFTYLDDQAKNSMASLAAADYLVYFKRGLDKSLDYVDAYTQFYQTDGAIMVTKKTKKSERELDIRPLILDMKVGTVGSMQDLLPAEYADPTPYLPWEDGFCLNDSDVMFYLFLTSGSTDNLKPELVMEALHQKMGADFDAANLGIHRLDMFRATEAGYQSLSKG